jgi:hypothetical protein
MIRAASPCHFRMVPDTTYTCLMDCLDFQSSKISAYPVEVDGSKSRIGGGSR